jgi:hypothetical protein
MSAPADPGIVAQVPFTLVDDFIRALGAKTPDVEQIHIDADGISLTTFRRTPNGDLFAAGKRRATAVTLIGFEPHVKADAL